MGQLSMLCSGTDKSLKGEVHLCELLDSEHGAFPFSQQLLYLSCADHLSPKHYSLPELNHIRREGFSPLPGHYISCSVVRKHLTRGTQVESLPGSPGEPTKLACEASPGFI